MTNLKADAAVSSNVVWHLQSISAVQRSEANGHKSAVLWYTGLSGSGKSTVANAVDQKLFERGCHTYVLDGDNVRHGLNGDLTFSDKDRVENIRRIGEVSKLFVDSGLLVSTAFISPFASDRKMVRDQLPADKFVEVFIDTPIEICEQRDPKGLYKKARNGEIKNFTGIDSAYDIPESPEVHLKTANKSIEACADEVVAKLVELGLID
ncbi:adenylyl-sulfate kinase [Psychrosphaera sp. 1_MG-2023]|uniref:adenylyl-sulfate kinase n=1 Tax=Psychrosphaera sp. 1_MG-2023 TaxID=3062643 RepID=UPI0026E1EDA9|nr:adenylyl-sulfate kinase [Psychrosphaera sp. 1_MG-2023]MDO6720005.1 adenylyl-sulfate kinase [Psychrosphaera sp. 1_MG-2023]